MQRNISLLSAGLILLMAGFLLLPPLFAQWPKQTMKWTMEGHSRQQWEYRVLPMSEIAGTGDEADQARRVESKFNDLGADGWEFCQIHLRVAVFKRPKETGAANADALHPMMPGIGGGEMPGKRGRDANEGPPTAQRRGMGSGSSGMVPRRDLTGPPRAHGGGLDMVSPLSPAFPWGPPRANGGGEEAFDSTARGQDAPRAPRDVMGMGGNLVKPDAKSRDAGDLAAQLNGTWQYVAAISADRISTYDESLEMQLVILDNTWAIFSRGSLVRGTVQNIEYNEQTSPVSFVRRKGNMPRAVGYGIFRVIGEHLMYTSTPLDATGMGNKSGMIGDRASNPFDGSAELYVPYGRSNFQFGGAGGGPLDPPESFSPEGTYNTQYILKRINNSTSALRQITNAR